MANSKDDLIDQLNSLFDCLRIPDEEMDLILKDDIIKIIHDSKEFNDEDLNQQILQLIEYFTDQGLDTDALYLEFISEDLSDTILGDIAMNMIHRKTEEYNLDESEIAFLQDYLTLCSMIILDGKKNKIIDVQLENYKSVQKRNFLVMIKFGIRNPIFWPHLGTYLHDNRQSKIKYRTFPAYLKEDDKTYIWIFTRTDEGTRNPPQAYEFEDRDCLNERLMIVPGFVQLKLKETDWGIKKHNYLK